MLLPPFWRCCLILLTHQEEGRLRRKRKLYCLTGLMSASVSDPSGRALAVTALHPLTIIVLPCPWNCIWLVSPSWRPSEKWVGAKDFSYSQAACIIFLCHALLLSGIICSCRTVFCLLFSFVFSTVDISVLLFLCSSLSHTQVPASSNSWVLCKT